MNMTDEEIRQLQDLLNKFCNDDRTTDRFKTKAGIVAHEAELMRRS
jgi:hypothetical protein